MDGVLDTDRSFIYSVAGNYNLAMNGLGEFNTDKVIPLGIKAFSSGSHQIVATDLSSFAPSAMIYLYDAETGAVQNLRNNSSYIVNLDAGSYEGRFFIQFTPAVQLSSQNATCSGNDGNVTLTYNSTAVLNVSIKNQNGIEIATLSNFNGQHTFNNLEAGNYEVTYTHTNGNESVDYFTIGGLTQVSIQATADLTQVEVGENINFSALSSTGTTNWNFGDGVSLIGNDVNHSYTANGNYLVTATVDNGECSKTIEIPVYVNSATGIAINDLSNAQWFVTGNQITVKFSDVLNSTSTFELIDLSGKVVISKSFSKGLNQISISGNGLADGIYIAKVISNENTLVKKLSIRK